MVCVYVVEASEEMMNSFAAEMEDAELEGEDVRCCVWNVGFTDVGADLLGARVLSI